MRPGESGRHARSRRGVLLALMLTALAVSAPASSEASGEDPWIHANRAVFRFNEALDRAILEPVATGYDVVMPDPAQRGVRNFFTNLRFPVVFVNCLLQAKPDEAITSMVRFLLNTSIGVGGFGDPASRFGMPMPNEDFGQTLGRWGVGAGPYVVLPLLGPSTVRDVVGSGADGAAAVWPWFAPRESTLGSGLLGGINARSLALDSIRDARADALDFYVFVRDAYLQRRRALVEDRTGESARGLSPEQEDDLYFFDDDMEDPKT